ncbi:Protein lethal(2)essential for life like protein [Argiope bruennichi]|uniref:Protein lethal(2)essential for life like protein n=1 Tax=Argiope bruennichi TaxID=94029 RepID=A0A8T0FE41_ARGBR|nr:Protein lethal(2)essential for life like protein [Argiope bruennichi]
MFARLLRDMYDPFDYRYGMGVGPSLLLDDYVSPAHVHLNIVRPRRQTSVTSKDADSKKGANQFKVMLNVKHFRPDEIEVKTVDNFIVIHGKHEEHADEHGFVSREFTRRYQLPDDVEPQKVKSSLSQDGVLTISAPRKAIEPPPKNERVVPITIQQPAAVEEAQKQQQQIQEQQAAEQQSSEEQK